MTEAGWSAGGGGVQDCDRAPPTQRDSAINRSADLLLQSAVLGAGGVMLQ